MVEVRRESQRRAGNRHTNQRSQVELQPRGPIAWAGGRLRSQDIPRQRVLYDVAGRKGQTVFKGKERGGVNAGTEYKSRRENEREK